MREKRQEEIELWKYDQRNPEIECKTRKGEITTTKKKREAVGNSRKRKRERTAKTKKTKFQSHHLKDEGPPIGPGWWAWLTAASDCEQSPARGRNTAAGGTTLDEVDEMPVDEVDETTVDEVDETPVDDSDSSAGVAGVGRGGGTGVAGGRMLAGEVPDEPAPLHLEAATPGPAIGLKSQQRPAGAPAGAGSPIGGAQVPRVRREVDREGRLKPGRSRRRGRRGQPGCVGLPDNRAVALVGVERRMRPTRWMSAEGESLRLRYN